MGHFGFHSMISRNSFISLLYAIILIVIMKIGSKIPICRMMVLDLQNLASNLIIQDT